MMQKHINPFVVMAGLYLSVGLLAVAGKLSVESGLIESLPRLRWLTIHFVTIGGMTQALFGFLPSLTDSIGGTERSVDGTSRWWQWLLLNAGYPLILIGMATSSTTTAVAGATIVLGALGLLIVTIYRTSRRGHDLLRYYRVAPWFLVIGILAAFGMLLNIHGPGGYFGSIEAHVHANVWGFLALIVAATVLTLLPALFETELRFPQLVPVTFWGVTLGAVGLVAGPWLARHELTMLGLAIYVIGTIGLLVNIVGTYHSSDYRRPKQLGLVLGGYLWLVFPVPWAPLVLLFPDTVPAGPIEIAAINGLVFGWMLQLAMAFLPVVTLASGRSTADDLVEIVTSVAGDITQPSWIQVGSVNVGMFALWLTAFPSIDPIAETLTLGGYALIAIAWLLFVISFWRSLENSSGRKRPSQLIGD
ncbi:cbb3-type cytochrome c oxidase subunit I (plasmid) [Halorussus limi]|uniref:Cbb3-type cytochrome c oxidase subunit I n=1 Tax=Halorussus limi TaxID=2938695 RepID=A0A8U0I2Q4_9EURY|nr:cbb3-type cytochrome c oxidase subunit I [Halorussus limi]UPV76934.1 cbb3-type cytochrome c oxidase subunit I [Halorussus limi]